MKIIIIGGVAAGAKAAAKSKRMLPDAEVHIYTQDTHVSYSSCGLPYYIAGDFADWHKLIVRTKEEFEKSGIGIHLEHRVTKILPADKKILIKNLSTNTCEFVKYDKLIIATGSHPFIPEIKNSNLKNIYTVRTLEDGINIRKKMNESKNITILGGGYIAIEMIEAFVKNGLKVTLLERGKKIMPSFDSEMSDEIKKRIELSDEKNFQILTGEAVVEIVGKNGLATKVLTSSGKEIDTEIIVLCVGVIPNSEIAQEAGIVIGKSGAIKVNKFMQTSVANIYACGDCCEEPHLINGKSVWVPLGSTANKEGRCAALNAAGIYTVFEGVLSSSVTRCLNTTMSMTGFTEKVAKEYGYTPETVTVNKHDMVDYMPEASEITLKIVAEKTTGLLLGGQAVGSIGADKRINTLATALVGKLTVKEFAANDLTYSPPFSTTIDPLLDAMNILSAKLSEN